MVKLNVYLRNRQLFGNEPVQPSLYAQIRQMIGTQKLVAAQLGITPNTLARRERGEIILTREMVLAMDYLAVMSKQPAELT